VDGPTRGSERGRARPALTDIAAARTFLFVPGDRPDRFTKAVASGADAVVLDLEDAVAPTAKPGARDHVARWLAQGHQAVVRINAEGTPWHAADVALIRAHPGAVPALMTPKAEDAERLTALARALPAGTGIIPLIESAAGVLRAAAVCAVPGSSAQRSAASTSRPSSA
jgi:citrate lyase subunit beta / citryl-CoA lyase